MNVECSAQQAATEHSPGVRFLLWDRVSQLGARMRLVPDTPFLMAVVSAGAFGEAQAGTLPGGRFQMLGSVIQGVLWMGLFTGITVAFLAIAPEESASTRRVIRRVALALGLALLSTLACRFILDSATSPSAWFDLFYLRRLLPPALVALWCVVILPRESRTLAQSTRRPSLAPWPQLALLVFVAAVLVSGADLAFGLLESTTHTAKLKSEVILRPAWVANIMVLFSAYGLSLAITQRFALTLLLVSMPYLAFGLTTLLKIRYMHTAVQPMDFIRLPEFLPFFRGFFGTEGLLTALVGLALWVVGVVVLWWRAPHRIRARRRLIVALLSLLVLAGVPAVFFAAYRLPFHGPTLRASPSDRVAKKLVEHLGASGRGWKEPARVRGFLLSFISELPTAAVTPPPNYSARAVADAVQRLTSPSAATHTSSSRVNLIVYLVESLMDLDDLGLQFTADPTPNLRGLRRNHIHGYMIVPEQFGGSINTEFEALTGMTRAFLPPGSLSYRQYVWQPLPSLPRTLARLGYTTAAVQADPRYYFDRERVYRLLGFDRSIWLREEPRAEQDAAGRGPSDRAVVQSIIQMAGGPKPMFVFAFTSSTHSPYNTGTFRGSYLDVIDPSEKGGRELKEYVNMVHVADQAIGELTRYFAQRRDSTIIVILGDHLPPLPEAALAPFLHKLEGLSAEERDLRVHRVPLLVWSNFRIPPEKVELGVFGLTGFLMEKLRLQPGGFLGVSDAVRRKLPVLGAYVRDSSGRAWKWDSLPRPDRLLLDDFRLLQHDVLLGKQYSLQDLYR